MHVHSPGRGLRRVPRRPYPKREITADLLGVSPQFELIRNHWLSWTTEAWLARENYHRAEPKGWLPGAQADTSVEDSSALPRLIFHNTALNSRVWDIGTYLSRLAFKAFKVSLAQEQQLNPREAALATCHLTAGVAYREYCHIGCGKWTFRQNPVGATMGRQETLLSAIGSCRIFGG
jgi:hypothetical protein